ncbi:P-loop containing nucleoside triphosphate hydrolase protein [Crassisporium funariophilum]|nr:P-loop containing nucleoside triphosphate hydrolase protein [Crassisporium funariophilum]
MHNPDMANARYGRMVERQVQSDFKVTVGCIQAGIDFHKHIGIGQEKPFKLLNDTLVAYVGTEGASTAEPVLISNITAGVIREVRGALETRIQETIYESMADILAKFWPKPPRPLDDNNLRPVSDIAPHPSRLQALCQFLRNPNAQFSCPEQAILLELMCQGKESVLGLLGTGKGKTMAILLYTYMYGHKGQMVVVLPLSSLHDDFARRAGERGIRTARWVPSRSHDQAASIIYVAVEYLGSKSFQADLMNLQHIGRLNLLVFDEIHLLLTESSYRDAFLQFWVLNLVNTPIIALDGSMPPSCMDEFSSLTNMSWRVIRTPSNRPELGYEIRRPLGDIVTEIARDIPLLISQYRPEDRLMVFCRTHDDVEKLGALLGLQPFTSRTRDTNEGTMKEWLEGKQKVMISTSILGCGLDYPSVRHVLHAGISYNMISQHQAESRGGRDGLPAMAITYVPAHHRPPRHPSGKYGLTELQEWAAEEKRCLRISRSLYLDGVAVTCSLLPSCTLCAVCRSQLDDVAPANAQSLIFNVSLPTCQQPAFYKSNPIPKRRSIRQVLETPHTYDLPLAITPPAPEMQTSWTESSTMFNTSPLDLAITPTAPEMQTLWTLSSSPPTTSLSNKRPGDQGGNTGAKRPRLAITPSSSASFMESQQHAQPSSKARVASGKSGFTTAGEYHTSLPAASMNRTPNPPPPPSHKLPSTATGPSSMNWTPNPCPPPSYRYTTTAAGPSLARGNPKPAPGIMARVDAAAVRNSAEEFDMQVRQPVVRALEILDSHCIVCICLGLDSHGHGPENCVQEVMSWKPGNPFRTFKDNVRFISGCCFGCGLNTAAFPHKGDLGQNCKDRGKLIRLLYGFSWGTFRFSMTIPLRELQQWIHNFAPGSSYGKHSYLNSYALLLWTMNKAGLMT